MAILHVGSLLTKLLCGEGFEDIEKHHLKAWFHVAVAPLLPRLFSGRFSAGLGARVAGVRSRGARCAMVSERGGGVAVVAVPAVAECRRFVSDSAVSSHFQLPHQH